MPLPPNLFCGPAGWSYSHWNGVVYPRVKTRAFHPLEYLSRYFNTVEINTSFYQPIRPEIARLWVRKVSGNPDFLFTAKLPRRFTHDRVLDDVAVGQFKDGMWPILRARKLGCLLMQFPWTFRFTEENRDFVIKLRRTFHEFPLVAEMRHGSWMHEEALGVLIDYKVGFCNIDQAPYTKAMPPTSHLTSDIGYVRLHGRNPQDWVRDGSKQVQVMARHDYLYNPAELLEWTSRIEEVRRHASRMFVITNNDAGGKSVVNALQIAMLAGDGRHAAPAELIGHYPGELGDYTADTPVQAALFEQVA